MGPEFVLCTLLSLGRFSTERELLLQNTLRDCFRHAKLVGDKNDEDSLELYSNQVMNKYVSTQLLYLPNGQCMIDAFIIQAGDLFDSVLIKMRFQSPICLPSIFLLCSSKMMNF